MFMIWAELIRGFMNLVQEKNKTIEENMEKEIKRYLKKKKEVVIVDLMITNYSKSNFYLAIVYNFKIDMYKVLYIPLDIVEDGKIEDFACYQFIDYMSIKYILENFKNKEEEFNTEFCNKENSLIDTYKVKINVNLTNKMYCFKTTRFIPKEWSFMFEAIVTIFQHAPHIVNGLCEDLLTLFKDEAEDIKYQESFEFDLLRYEESILKEKLGEEYFELKKISQVERINNKYFCIVNSKIVVIDYDFGVVNGYCASSEYKKYILTAIMGIRNNLEKKFSKIMLVDKEKASKVKYYLVYGITKKGFKVIRGAEEEIIMIDNYHDGLIKILEDYHDLEEKIEK